VGPSEGSFPRHEEKISLVLVKLQVVGSHPLAYISQAFIDVCCDLGVRVGEGKEQLGVVCLAVIVEAVGCNYRA